MQIAIVRFFDCVNSFSFSFYQNKEQTYFIIYFLNIFEKRTNIFKKTLNQSSYFVIDFILKGCVLYIVVADNSIKLT